MAGRERASTALQRGPGKKKMKEKKKTKGRQSVSRPPVRLRPFSLVFNDTGRTALWPPPSPSSFSWPSSAAVNRECASRGEAANAWVWGGETSIRYWAREKTLGFNNVHSAQATVWVTLLFFVYGKRIKTSMGAIESESAKKEEECRLYGQ